VIEIPQKTERKKRKPIRKDDNQKIKNGWYEPAAGLQKQTNGRDRKVSVKRKK
jgi:hypothetical protein